MFLFPSEINAYFQEKLQEFLSITGKHFRMALAPTVIFGLKGYPGLSWAHLELQTDVRNDWEKN